MINNTSKVLSHNFIFFDENKEAPLSIQSKEQLNIELFKEFASKSFNVSFENDDYCLIYIDEETNEKIEISDTQGIQYAIENHDNSHIEGPIKIEVTYNPITKLSQVTQKENISKADQLKNAKKIQKSGNETLDLLCEQFCCFCNEKLGKQRYICIICDEYILCQDCLEYHTPNHPLIYISHKEYPLATNKKELVNFTLSDKDDNKNDIKLISKFIPNRLSNFFKTVYYLEFGSFYAYEKNFSFAINSKYQFEFTVVNAGNTDINKPIEIIFENTDSLKVTCGRIERLPKGEVTILCSTFESFNEKGEYNIQIKPYSKYFPVKYNTFIIKVFVVESNEVDKVNAENMFSQYKKLNRLNTIDKQKLYNIVKKGMIKKTLKEIENLYIKCGEDFNKLMETFSTDIEDQVDEKHNE